MSNPFGRKAAFRSALLMTGATYITYATGLVVSTLIARSLGPADYGRYAYLVWLSGILIILCNNGLTTSGIRFVSECMGRNDARNAANVHGWLQRRHYLSLVLVAVVFAMVVPFVKPAGWEAHLWLFAAVALVSAVAKSGYLFGASVAKGYGQFGIEAMTTNVMSGLSLLVVLVLTLVSATLESYLVAFVAISAGHTVLTYLLMRRNDIRPSKEPIDAELASRMRQHLGWSIVLTLVAAFSNKSIETFLLNATVGPEAVGFFTIAAALTRGGVDLLSSGLSGVLMPSMAHAFGAGGIERVNRILSSAVRYFHFLGLLLAGVGALWAGPVIGVMYGTKFHDATFVLQVMVLVGGLTLTEGAFGAVLSTTDNQRMRAWVAMFSVAVTAVAAVALVPRYGLMGAVLAHAVSRVIVFTVVSLGVARFMKATLPYRELFRLLAAAAGAAVPAALIVLSSQSLLSQFIAGFVYALAYLGLTLLLRVWHAEDVNVIASAASRLPFLRGLPAWLQRWVYTG